MKKKKKISTPKKIKRLQNKANRLWFDICILRDKNICQVKLKFPHININHSDMIQVDHCFSRSFKRLFLEISNGTTVCQVCNSTKSGTQNRWFKANSALRDAVTLAIFDIVKQREGGVFDRMRGEVEQGGAFPEWRRVHWLEDKVAVLKEIKEMYEEGII